MEHIFSVFVPNLLQSGGTDLYEWILEKKCIFQVSNKNILAFVASTDIKTNKCEYSYNNIYILDLNLPNEPHLIENHPYKVCSLEWDFIGNKLLVGDVEGNLNIWSIKDNLINQWVLFYEEKCFDGEAILMSIWFHNGMKYILNFNKKDLQLCYNEKFEIFKIEPTIKQFAQKPTHGFLCVSNSGIISTTCFLSNGSIIREKEVLKKIQNKIETLDICYKKNGELLIATSNGSVDYPINFYKVSLSLNLTDFLEKNQLVIKCDDLNSFFLNCHTNQVNNDEKLHKFVTHIKFITKEDSNLIIVGCSVNSGSTLELWELQRKNYQINKLFVNNENSQESQYFDVWTYISNCNYSHRISCLTVSNNLFYNTYDSSSQLFIMVAYKDNVIRCLTKDNLYPIGSININSAYKNSSNNKIMQYLNINDIQFTWSTSGLIVLDSASQIFYYKMPPIIDPRTTINNPSFVVMLLEYSMLCDYDWWDILLTIKPNIIENICDRFTENFQFQHHATKQKYRHIYLAIKGSIYRLSSQVSLGLNKSGDCYALLLLNSICNLHRSLLRSTKNSEKDGPVENISNLIQNSNEVQLTQIMLMLENKDYCVESNILQSLQHLNQWVGDLALFLIGSYPHQCHNNIRVPGGGLIEDINAINTIRELLTIIRIWGLLNESCLPVFTKLNDNIDIISQLYLLLTKSIAYLRTEPDEKFLDECYSLQNNVLIPQLDLTLKARGILSPSLFCNELPLVFNYYKDDNLLNYQVKIPTIDGAVNYNLNKKIDVIRRISLGNVNNIKMTNIQICTRCESVSLINPSYKTSATMAWEKTWQKNCLCGGHWKINI